ncbi:hypothetical protein ACOWPH_11650 [Anabaena sp. PCC 7938]|uniref:hypothetical protein n=1 Tax=Anabaena TaxID=1163 RepID=UPI0003007594|nr:hypothetical protein [Anabaena cylindrica]
MWVIQLHGTLATTAQPQASLTSLTPTPKLKVKDKSEKTGKMQKQKPPLKEAL